MNAGTVGVLSGEQVRYAQFAIALMHQQLPEGTKLIWQPGVNVISNMNAMVTGMEGDWLWMIGDDHVFNPDLLQRLLAHDVDVVVPLCLKRTPPYQPVVYSHQNELGEYVGHFDLPAQGLFEVYAAGTAGMLVRRYVLDALADPVFETGPHGLNEDLTFCAKVRDAGFTIWCDVESPLGHITNVAVWPLCTNGGWSPSLHLGNGLIMPLKWLPDPELAAV